MSVRVSPQQQGERREMKQVIGKKFLLITKRDTRVKRNCGVKHAQAVSG